MVPILPIGASLGSVDTGSSLLKSLYNTWKASGSDGLSVEFFLRFGGTLGPLLLRVSNQCLSDGEGYEG